MGSVMRKNKKYLALKYVVAGDAAVGKTKLLRRYVNGKLENNLYQETIGVDFYLKPVQLCEIDIKIQLWDLSGQKRYQSLTNVYFKGADAIMLCFDITRMETFTKLRTIVTGIKKSPYCQFVLVGTHSDLKNKRTVQVEEAQKYAEELGADYIETSATTGVNVGKLFGHITPKVLQSPKHHQVVASLQKENRRIANYPTQIILDKLTCYRNRIEKHKIKNTKINFKYGFWPVLGLFFMTPSSRAKNREANYLLTCALIEALRGPHAINQAELFSSKEVTRLRDEKSKKVFSGCYCKRGIWSSELNGILRDARKAFYNSG